jgi:hypothetical protein
VVVDLCRSIEMSARDNERVASVRRHLVDLLAEPGGALPGGIVERMMKCGKPSCRCKADPPQLHGPYLQWGYSKGRRRFTRWLTPEQAERYRPEIERGRRITELLVHLDEVEIRRVERAEGWGT